MKDDVEAIDKGIKALENQKILPEQLEKIKAEILKRFNGDCHYDQFTVKEIVKYIDYRIKEEKEDVNTTT